MNGDHIRRRSDVDDGREVRLGVIRHFGVDSRVCRCRGNRGHAKRIPIWCSLGSLVRTHNPAAANLVLNNHVLP